MRDEVLAKIIDQVAKVFKKDPAELSSGTKFSQDLGAKSINIAQLINFLGDEYDVEIAFMEFRRKKTLGEAADYIAELLEG